MSHTWNIRRPEKSVKAKSSLGSGLARHLRGGWHLRRSFRGDELQTWQNILTCLLFSPISLSLLDNSFWKPQPGFYPSLFGKASNAVIQIFQVRLSLEATKNIFINSSAVPAFFRGGCDIQKKKRGYLGLLSTLKEKEKRKRGKCFIPDSDLLTKSRPDIWGNLCDASLCFPTLIQILRKKIKVSTHLALSQTTSYASPSAKQMHAFECAWFLPDRLQIFLST